MRQSRSAGTLLWLLLLPAALLAPTNAGAADDITGFWLGHERDGHIEIKACGSALCGYVVSILDPNVPANARDINNEKPEQRSRPICELQILGNLQDQGDAWGGGWVYDPRAGKAYDAEVKLQDVNTLAVRGYLGIKILGETKSWTRASKDIRRCTRPR
jgi:uncharacterized protein (DUF2147 family)